MANGACSVCDAEMPARARFCASCGAAASAGGNDTRLADTELEPSSALPAMRLAPGTRVSVYRVEEIVGEGGMGVVYRAHDEAMGRTVALKCLHTNFSGDEQIRRRFAREAKVLRSWVHPNVVGVFDFIEHEHLLAIVMEYVDGKSLVHHLARWRGKMPFTEVRSILGAVLETMQDGHARGIVHRDLKPENILVVNGPEGPRPKIVDFGISKILEGTSYTVSGAFLGTCRYISPEQVKAPHTVDVRSDVYSLGVTLYQLVAGRVPFDAENHFALLMAHVGEAPPPPSRFRPDVPPALETLILDALAKDPAARPQSCAIFHQRLEAALAGIAPAHATTTERPLAAVLEDTGGYEMVLVPAGPFLMGRARRTIQLDAFYIDRTPVTNEQFARFVEITGYQPSGAGADRFLRGDGLASGGTERARRPVAYVSWADAKAYAQWAGKRLPTEAEWEKAARGTDGRKYPWGRANPEPSLANFDRSLGGTTPVGAFPAGASPFGALDMAGNVWEWCEDYDDASFYEDGPAFNPCNTMPSAKVVMRGGAWMFGPRALRTFARTSYAPEYRFAAGGFRCARTA
jgi:formylglycine-generating enzyme required for sulfatase activity/predicted Ser/Thr protein kinase